MPPSEDTSGKQCNHSGSAILEAESLLVQPQASLSGNVTEEWIQEFDGECFRKAIQQEESDEQP